MIATLGVVWILGQVVLGHADKPAMPGAAAVAAWGMRAFTPAQESEFFHNLADYETLALAALAPGHGLSEDVFTLCRDRAVSKPALAAVLEGWAKGDVAAPAPRDGMRIWGPAPAVDSLVAEDRAKAAAWLAELDVAPGELPEGASPDPLSAPAFPPQPCATGTAAGDGHGTIAGVARSVDGVLVEKCAMYLPSLQSVVMTDAAGRFEFCGVPAGAQELRAAHTAHRDLAGTVPVLPGQVTRIEILLHAPHD